ncbi:DMT family transporter [Maribacter sp. 2304DJ31-5]|uniref:DMT family transporter n=1 Tax=Maribacter sp. 2304DJ31-5 TaxID=3386273 RepID=UPI0039BC6B72
MQRDRTTNLLHLHFIVLIWGFTAILGKLITIGSLPLVWYRMGLATLFIFLYLIFAKLSLRISKRAIWWFVAAGIVIALHWVTFFWAIKVATVSVALAMMSAGAFFTALMEPFLYKRRIIGYEVIFGLLVIVGLYLIFKVESKYVYGMAIALISAFLAAVFSLINGKLVKTYRPSVISFYEMGIGVLFLTILLGCRGNFSGSFFNLNHTDWIYLLILALFCTAYAFIASVKVMQVLTPYTVMLTTNLEPVYGILLAWILFGSEEKMNPLFYLGTFLILITVIANGILKQRANRKRNRN